MGVIIIFTAPSGTGKSTIIDFLMKQHELNLEFSISATSRAPRGQEKNGVEYYFLSPEEFKTKIKEGEFIEYCEVYTDKFYGTLKSEVDRKLSLGKNIVLDLDVVGAQRVKKLYGARVLSIFILPPSLDVLRQRLTDRGTETEEAINIRINRAKYELGQANNFDCQILNEQLNVAEQECVEVIQNFIKSHQ